MSATTPSTFTSQQYGLVTPAQRSLGARVDMTAADVVTATAVTATAAIIDIRFIVTAGSVQMLFEACWRRRSVLSRQ